MLFTTLIFFGGFLPLTLVGFFILGHRSHLAAAGWLLLASLFFYAYWMPVFTSLLIFSIVTNYFFGRQIGHAGSRGQLISKRLWASAGIVFNLALLSYFKYAGFLIDSLNAVFELAIARPHITFPIGISFFSFTQIAFLADTYKGAVREYRPVHYGLFVTYFPHLVAGPVLHHAQMMPQFAERTTYRINPANLAAGFVVFVIGLIKKIVMADGVSPLADAVFNAAQTGISPSQTEAWYGALAYTFQLYFDFSGYSDMAIGLSLMFNIQLPFNFNSPYRALSISEFWRRWHMTLSTFLRDYLYIPLGGNRHGGVRRYVNLMLTMLLGGLWHGASWTFVFWGGLHGLYLAANHGFAAYAGAWRKAWSDTWIYRGMAWLITFIAVVFAWVFFRAATFDSAALIVRAMLRFGAAHPTAGVFWNAGLDESLALLYCSTLGAIAVLAPNSNRLGEAIKKRCVTHPRERWVVLGFAVTLAAFLVVLNDSRNGVSPFIYFNF